MSYKCRIDSLDKVIEVEEGESLLHALKQAGLSIKSSCGGCASCSDCIIEVINGEENMLEMQYDEKKLLGNVFHLTKERLSCQVRLRGDVEIGISRHSQEGTKVFTKSILKKKVEPVEGEEEEVFEKKTFRAGGKRRPKRFKFSDDDE